jgi:heptaprenyl diphosphate synthase
MNTRRVIELSIFLAISVILGYIESFLPSFVHGIKLGLANIIILIVLLYFSWWQALLLSLIRVFIVSLLVGSIFQFGFYVSLAGALASFLIMFIVHIIFKEKISVFGVSIAGSFFHVTAQLFMVFILMNFNTGTFYYLPWLMLFSFPMGALTGFIMHMINKSPLRASLLKEEGEKA